jgi:hypothetical protein
MKSYGDMNVAIEIRDYLRRWEDTKLANLAHWMRDSGGPVDQMDASVKSVDLLGIWFEKFVGDGCPGLPTDGIPQVEGMPAQLTAELSRGFYAASHVDAYLKRVAQRIDPMASYEIYEDPKPRGSIRHLATGVKLGTGDFLWNPTPHAVAYQVITKENKYHKGFAPWSKPFASQAPVGFVPASQDRAPSILTPYLSSAKGPVTIPPRSSTRGAQDDAVSPEPLGASMTLASVGTAYLGSDNLADLEVLDARRVREALTDAGFTTTNGQAITETDLLVNDAEFPCNSDDDYLAQATIGVHDGALRAVWIDGMGATAGEWDRIVKPFAVLAPKIGARIESTDRPTESTGIEKRRRSRWRFLG